MEKQPVILQVLPSLGTGGVERGTIDMARAIINAGGKAIVASEEGIGKYHLEKMGAIFVGLPLASKNPWVIWKNYHAIVKLIQKYQVDIVHARSRAPAWSAWFAARKCQVNFITTWHGVYDATWWGKRLYNKVMTKGIRVIAISNYVSQQIREIYGVRKKRLRIIPRGVDTSLFDPSLPFLGKRVIALAQKWSVSESQRVILLPGRITSWKGHELLIQAFAKLSGKYPDWICVFGGPVKEKDHFVHRLLCLAEALKVKEKIYFIGDSQDMPAVLAFANLVVVPSLKPEPFGRVVIEAQAMEKVVIVADHGGAAETVKDKISGYGFQPNNVKDLIRVLDEVMQKSQEELQVMGHVARENVLKAYTLQKMEQATLQVYNEVLPVTQRFVLK